jgi:hypothetical protein
MATIIGVGAAVAGVGLSAYQAFSGPDGGSSGGGYYPQGADPYMEQQLDMMEAAGETMGAAARYDKQMEARRRSMQNMLGTDAQAAGAPDYLADAATAGEGFQAPVDANGQIVEGTTWRQGFSSRKGWKELVKAKKAEAKAAGQKPKGVVKDLKAAGITKKTLKANAELWEQSYAAAAAGDYTKAQELRNQAHGQLQQWGLATPDGQISASLGGGTDFHQAKLKKQEKAAWRDLQSPSALLVGARVAEARQMQDPNSEMSQRFMHNMTDDAIAELSQAEDEAHDALALAERESARSSRDFAGAAGSMRSFGAEQAQRERSAERFGMGHALTRQQTAVAKAKVYGEAARYYNEFRTAYADSALAAAENWVNNQSFVRDSFRQLQMTAATALMGVSSMGAQLAAQTGQTAMSIASNERLAAREEAFAAQQAKAQQISTMSGALLGLSSTILKSA